MPSVRRFPPPCTAEETACFIVRDANGQALAYVYSEDEPGRRSAAKLLTKDEAQLIAAYPVHPELFRMLQTDWSALEKFQKTRGLLKMMAQIVYRLWRDGHSAPMILPGDVPLTDDKVRTNALLPIANGYDAVIAREVAGDLSKPAQA